MKLVRYGKLGREKPGILDSEGQIRDLSTKLKDIDGKTINPNSLKLIQRVNMKKLTIVLWSICAVILYIKTGYLKL